MLTECASELVAVVTLPDFNFEEVYRSGRRLLQLPKGGILAGLPLTSFLDPALAQALQTAGLAAISRKRPWHGDGTLHTFREHRIPIRLHIIELPTTTTGSTRALVTITDRTSEDRLQAVFENERVLLHALLDHLPDAIYFKDRKSRFIRASTALARRLGGRQAHELIGQTDFDYYADEHARQAYEDEQRILDTGEPLIEVEEKESWPDGHSTWVCTSKFPLPDAHGNVVGTFGISRDITARKRAEEERARIEQQLQLAQKMESIGRLAAGVAHEINTPAQFVNDNIFFLLDAYRQMTRVLASYRSLRDCVPEHPECRAALEAASSVEKDADIDYLLAEIPRTLEQSADGLARIARIVRSLKEFAHPNPPEKQPTDLNQLVESAIAVSRHEWKLVADVVEELDPNLPQIPCVVDEINQIMLNLIVNAAQAISGLVAEGVAERGRITVRTRRVEQSVLIEVEDSGPGMTPQVQKRVFEPFFTTKPIGQGTGQGLALVHTYVVKNHGGSVDFTSTPGQGTTFRVTLPIDPADQPREEVGA